MRYGLHTKLYKVQDYFNTGGVEHKTFTQSLFAIEKSLLIQKKLYVSADWLIQQPIGIK